jgi:hypothetical protein
MNQGNLLTAARGTRVGRVSEANRTEWVVSGQSQGRRWDPESKRTNIGNLSGRALDDDNNPQNALRLAREQGWYQNQNTRASQLEAYANAMMDYQKQLKANRRGALVSAGIALGTGALMGERMFSPEGGRWGAANTAGGRLARGFGNIGRRAAAAGRGFQNWASGAGGGGGGNLAGPNQRNDWGYNAQDYRDFRDAGVTVNADGSVNMAKGGEVPALLTGGEFVVNRKAVDSMGVGFFDKLNSGVFKKFHDGGFVGDEGVASASLGGESSSGEMVNNITVNVNVSGEGESTSIIGGQGVNEEKAKDLADMIQRQIVHTIIKEKRTGGILT